MRIEDKGKLASARGFANENRLLAALLERGYNASRVDLPHSTYDLVVELDHSTIIRIQVKTVSSSGSISFKGGIRGGVDREYASDVKEYVQSTETSDVVVGVRSIKVNGDSDVNFWFVPTIYIEHLGQKSIAVKKISKFKNNWKLLENCKDNEYILGILGR